MATIKREDGPRGPRWVVGYRPPGRYATEARFKTAKEARDFAAKVEHDKRAGSYLDPTRTKMTFRDMGERWEGLAPHADTTAMSRATDLRLHVYPVIGDIPLHRLTGLDLDSLLRGLEADLAPSTVTRIWAWVRAILNAAIRDKRLVASPATGVRPRKAIAAPPLILEPDAVAAILEALAPHYRTAAVLAAGAGLRLGEALGLTPHRVEWISSAPLIRVERQLIQVTGPPYLRAPKSGEARTVPVPAEVLGPLGEHLRSQPRAYAWDDIDKTEVELCFSSARTVGEPIRKRRLDEAFKTAVRRAGVDPRAHFHSLRHFYASMLIAGGHSEREVGERLGHSSATVTRLYGGLFESADDKTRHAVAATFVSVLPALQKMRIAATTGSNRRKSVTTLPTQSSKGAGQTP